MLIHWLKQLDAFEEQTFLVKTLEQLQMASLELPSLLASERWVLLKKNVKAINHLFETISALISSQEIGQSEVFVRFQKTDWKIKPPHLFFEDVSIQADISFPERAMQNTIEELVQLIKWTKPLQVYSEKESLFAFFKKNYKYGDEVPLLTFYEDFYKVDLEQRNALASSAMKSVAQLREQFATALKKNIKEQEGRSHRHLSLPMIEKAMATTGKIEVEATKNNLSYGVLLQMFTTETGGYKSYIDAVFTGYGKMFGRFMYLFDEQYTEHLGSWLKDLQGDAIWADLSDASYHNANAHPPLLTHIIDIAEGASSQVNIPLRELHVAMNAQSNELLLLHGKRQVWVFNMGLEALASRSPMYRLLSTFSVSQPDLSPFKDILTKVTYIEKNNWGFLPRIYVGEHLVLQRRAWYIPLEDLPFRKKGEQEVDYFLRLNLWRKNHGLPDCFFITLQPLELAVDEDDQKKQRAGDHYKPQYMDFTIPALVSHFARSLPHVKTMLKVEEMLPSAEQMLEVAGRKSVTECVLQFVVSD
ncbi:MAG TPA: hypothetical protein ENJ45_04460 [Phaeodactylibacter sp.]|nr:hypothetical protein [Phaeodactylibacter sp.]